ncbi:MAG TPA: geranylgeranylglycerol-phosphate geranylgeranyltransferase [Brumimicrobium sp.]|nr:geranylgeranylglycerol-phosphate geranylgeranyltransferase [Brumimicrobium sp.]
MIHFLRLIRPINLLIIAVTMYSVGGYLDIVYAEFNDGIMLIRSFNFFLLVISTVFIAAAGNIINDYFDVRADRINRPERTIIITHIKRRWAIVFHWVLNFIAFAIAIHLGLVLETFWYVFIHLLSINLLWFYSMQLKRTLVVGNVVIALLTALVPVLVGIYYQDFYRGVTLETAHPFHLNSYQFFPIYLGIGLGIFAFVLNLTREIVKDMEDVKGDLVLKARTIPIVYGLEKSRSIAVFFVFVTMALSIPIFWFWQTGAIDGIALVPLFLSALSAIFSLVILLLPINDRNLKTADLGLKLTIVFGMTLPLFWVFQLMQ